MPVDSDAMLHMKREELDDLFRSSPPGPIPKGEARGTVISHPGTEFAEIAAKLVLSVRTVDNHLQNAYSKLGVTAATSWPGCWAPSRGSAGSGPAG